jgi:hypothetical protein
MTKLQAWEEAVARAAELHPELEGVGAWWVRYDYA